MTNPLLENFRNQITVNPGDFPAYAHKTTVSILFNHGLLRISSTDNLKFLQGQFTCDVREVTTEQWRYGALCTNKGRMIANFILLQTGDNQHLVRVATDTLDTLQSTLKKFAPFYKGALDNISDDYVLFGINGPGSVELVLNTFNAAPDINRASKLEQATIVRLSENSFECWVNNKSVEALWSKLSASAIPTGSDYWDLLNIRSGLGEVSKPTIEEWTPHMLNLQAVGAISFKKGCYTGQEIVARTEYRGQQKRAMYRVGGQGKLPATASAVSEGEHKAGEIVVARWANPMEWEGLAVLSDKHLENNALHCEGQPLQLLTLPYAVK